MTTDEIVPIADDGEGDILCLCGNRPDTDGFSPCLADGTKVEPMDDGRWPAPLYLCVDCGRIIHHPTGKVIGRGGPAQLLGWAPLPPGYVLPYVSRIDDRGERVPIPPLCGHAEHHARYGWSADCPALAVYVRDLFDGGEEFACAKHAPEMPEGWDR